MSKECEIILKKFVSLKNEKNRIGMMRFGINIENAFGVSMVEVRNIAKKLKKNQILAEQLWESNIHEARILASIISEPMQISNKILNIWLNDINSWDLCDQCCINLFRYLPNRYELIYEWAKNDSEFIRRAGFSLMASTSVSDKRALNAIFIKMLNYIKNNSDDSRNFVKKSVNWALRQIGKRNLILNEKAIEISKYLMNSSNKTEKWIGKNAFDELTSEKVVKRLL